MIQESLSKQNQSDILKAKRSRTWLVVIGIVVLVIILTILVYFGWKYYQKNIISSEENIANVPTIKEEKKTEPTKEYKNEKFGLKLDYPQDWKAEENKKAQIITFINPNNTKEQIIVRVLDKDMEKVIRDSLEIVKEEEVTIGGKKGIKLVGKPMDGTEKETIYYVKLDNKIYHFKGTPTSKLEEIVNSVEFIKGEKAKETEWQVYKNDKYNYQVEYPKSYKLEVVNDALVYFKDSKNSDKTIGLTIESLKKDYTSIDAWIEDQKWPAKTSVSRQFEKITTIPNIDAYQQVQTGTVYFIKNKLLFMIENGIGMERKIVPENIFNHFLSSFKFLAEEED